MKWEITEVEDILGKYLKRDTYSLGVDQAQSNTGLFLLKTDKEFMYIESYKNIILKPMSKEKIHQQLLTYFKLCTKWSNKLPEVNNFKKIVIIEDCWMGLNPWTTKVLAKYAALSCLVFSTWTQDIPKPIPPISSRAKVGFKKNKESKMKLKEQLMWWTEDNFDLEINDDNLNDAFILALVGLIK